MTAGFFAVGQDFEGRITGGGGGGGDAGDREKGKKVSQREKRQHVHPGEFDSTSLVAGRDRAAARSPVINDPANQI